MSFKRLINGVRQLARPIGRGFSVAAAPTYASEVLADLPLIYWRGEELSGLVAVDSSGNERNGTISAGVTLGGTGRQGKGFTFPSGSDEVVSRAYSADINPAAFSVEAWVNFGAAPESSQYIAATMNSDQNSGFRFYRNASNSVFLGWSNATQSHTVSSPVVGNTWYHVVGTYDGSVGKLYVNGALVSQTSGSYVPTPDKALRVGSSQSGYGAPPFGGSIDEFALYGSVLSAERVAAHYAAGIA